MITTRRFVKYPIFYTRLASFAKVSKSYDEYIKALDFRKQVKVEEGKKETIDAETLKFLQERIKSKKSKITLDKEDFRIDCGLIIERNPIFLHLDKDEMEQMKLRHKYNKKYKRYFPITKELMDFRETPPNEEIEKADLENFDTHIKENSDGTRETYAAHSKLYNKADPNVTDKHSLQYAGANRVYLLVKEKGSTKWMFPTFYIEDKSNFSTAKDNAFSLLSEGKWRIYYPVPLPVLLTKRELTQEEKQDSVNRKAVGIKTYYFPATHLRGRIHLNPEFYEDYSWVPRLELNQFFDREDYNKFVHSTLLY
jgi:hypothetical protein